MSFIKNIDIWNNYIPRVCNYDTEDYCSWGAIGNTCTNNTQIPNTENIFTTARATSDAFIKDINNYIYSTIPYYYDIEYTDPITGVEIVPDGLLNDKCITVENYNALLNLYFGPNGLLHKYHYDFIPKRHQLANSLLADGDPEKLTGIVTYIARFEDEYRGGGVDHTISIDFTNYQTPSYDIYLEYRTVLGDFMQHVKNIMTASANHPLTKFEIPEENCDDVTIGLQTWTRCNLNVDTYRNGDPIPQVQDPTEWSNLTTGAWCYYENNTSYGTTFGKLYNWYAVTDPRGLAPEGYYIPTSQEWSTMIDYLGGVNEAGAKLKQLGNVIERECVTTNNAAYWQNPNPQTTNSSFFTALPSGGRTDSGTFVDLGYGASFWNATEYDVSNAEYNSLEYINKTAGSGTSPKTWGMAVRLIQDKTCTEDVIIGTQTWQCKNLNVSTYRNGDVIPHATDSNAWVAYNNSNTGAWCYYNNDPSTEATYGKLYNWYAINDPRGIGPTGWHIPSDAEWTTLTDYLGGIIVAGGKMKQVGTTNWSSPNTDASNESYFTALPGGRASYDGYFYGINDYGYWWSSTEHYTLSQSSVYFRGLNYDDGSVVRAFSIQKNGFSVRMLKD